MKSKDVLIIGAGISGCAMALALAKRGVAVTLIAAAADQRHYPSLTLPTSIVNNPQSIPLSEACPRALEHFYTSAKKNIEELLGVDFDQVDIYKSLQDQLKACSNVEWLTKHTALELITLDRHSLKQADIYKRGACIGVYAYHQSSKQIEPILAKETVLAAGSASSLFLHSIRPSSARGEGTAMAYRAGARLIPTTHVQFHPLCLYESSHSCYPLPIELIKAGAKVLNIHRTAIALEDDINTQFYRELLKTKSEHLWLDLTALDPVEIKGSFPSVDTYCLNRGFNIANDLLPIVPAAQYTNGGIAVDKNTQTTVQRLRAVGEVSCTGLFDKSRDELTSIMESLTWAVTGAEDIAKQINKFAYYFPDIIEWTAIEKNNDLTHEEDSLLMKQILWLYGGISRDDDNLRKASRILQSLQHQCNKSPHSVSIEEKIHLNALQASLLLVSHQGNH